MIVDFIKSHQRLFTVLLCLALVGVFVVISYQPFNTQPITEETRRPVGQDGAGEVESLPYENALYKIEYQQNPDGQLDKKIIITAYSGYRSAAVDLLYEFGMNPSDYKINFNTENPFGRYEKK